jgi:hypothetical protein
MHKASTMLLTLRQALLVDSCSQFFSYHAKLIQKIYRGFHSRKHVYDYYARKKYLNKLEVKNNEVKVQMEEYMRNSILEEQKRKEEAARAEFNEICKRVHHLASTRTIPGIYNSPYSAVGMKPQAFNVDIETHLKTSFKSTYQWKSPGKNKIQKYKEYTSKQNITEYVQANQAA